MDAAISATLELDAREYDDVFYVGNFGGGIDAVLGTIVFPSEIVHFETYHPDGDNVPMSLDTGLDIEKCTCISIEDYLSKEYASGMQKRHEGEHIVFDGELASVKLACSACNKELKALGVVTYLPLDGQGKIFSDDFLRGNDFGGGILNCILC